MRSTLIRSAMSLNAREALTVGAFIGVTVGAWLITHAPQSVHVSAVALRIVVDYCLSTS